MTTQAQGTRRCRSLPEAACGDRSGRRPRGPLILPALLTPQPLVSRVVLMEYSLTLTRPTAQGVVHIDERRSAKNP